MTRAQYEHHAEQMEAYRRDFRIAWETEFQPLLAHLNAKEMAMAQLKQWGVWFKTKVTEKDVL